MKSNPQTCQPPTALAAIVAALALALPATAASPEIGPLPYFNMYGPVFANAELIGEVKIERLGEPVEGAQIERRTAMFLPPGTASPIIAEQHYWVGPGAGGSSESPQPLRALDTGVGASARLSARVLCAAARAQRRNCLAAKAHTMREASGPRASL